MKIIILLMICSVSVIFTGCDLDNFLFNSKQIEAYQLPDNTIPDSLLDEVSFLSESNRLYGYWIASDGSRPGLVLIFCHGNKHNLDEYWDRVMMMHQLGANILIFDYRGYGKSEGESSEQGIYRDADAALDFIFTRGFVSDSIVVMGYSLGNVPAIYLTAKRLNPYRLICEAPFASSNSLTQGSIGLDLPAGWLTTGGFDNAENIKRIATPLLLIHGAKDEFVRWRDNGRVIFENAPRPKRLVLVENGDHNDLPQKLGEANYIALLREWIQ